MPSQIESAINRTRRLMASADAATRSRMVDLYAEAINGLEAALLKTAGIPLEDMTLGQLYADMRYRQLLAEAEAAFLRFADSAVPALMNGRTAGARIGQEQAVAMMRAAAPDLLTASFVRLPEAALQELIGTIGPGSPVRAVLAQYGGQAAQTIEAEFIRGITQGKNSREVARRIRQRVGGESWRVEALARNETLRPFRSATLATYQRHAHLLDGWAWNCAKGKRTCLACLALDGRVFPLSVQFMPTHSQCRCSAVPHRTGGPTENMRTGAQWFAAQSEATQRQMIPKGAWDDFSSGRLVLDDFIQRDHSPVWGDSFRESSIASARSRASARGADRVA